VITFIYTDGESRHIPEGVPAVGLRSTVRLTPNGWRFAGDGRGLANPGWPPSFQRFPDEGEH
jgi:hypothetical protein